MGTCDTADPRAADDFPNFYALSFDDVRATVHLPRDSVRHTHLLALIALAFSVSQDATAHHSFSAFDQSRSVTLAGTVKEWQWTNPHTWLYLLVTDESGKTQVWNIEGQSPQVMRSEQHYSRTSFKAGNAVKVIIHPRRDGSTGGSFVSATAADGSALTRDAGEPESK
jgi:hypothetical protein